MKKRYSIQGKDIFDVADNNDLVKQLRYRSIMFGHQSDAEYRKGFAKRHLQTTGQKIDPSSNDTFVRDLIKFKEIKKVAAPKKSSKAISGVSRPIAAKKAVKKNAYKVGDSVTYKRFTGVPTKGVIVSVDKDKKYVNVKNKVGNIEYIEVSKITSKP